MFVIRSIDFSLLAETHEEGRYCNVRYLNMSPVQKILVAGVSLLSYFYPKLRHSI